MQAHRPPFRVVLGVVLFVGLVVSSVGLWRVGFEARSQIENLAVASAESSQWTLSQSEVELLKFHIALMEAAEESADASALDEVRRRFDVFYARTRVLINGQVFTSVRDMPQVLPVVEEISTRLDGLIPLIDGPDPALRAALPRLLALTESFARDLRFVSLQGIQDFSLQSVARREEITSVLFNLAVFASVLVAVVLIVLATLMVLLARTHRARSQIAAAEDRLRAVIETAIDAVIIMDRNGRMLDYNKAAETIFGYRPSEALGRPISGLVLPPSGESGAIERPCDLLGDGSIVKRLARGKSGRQFPVEIATATAKSAGQEIIVSFLRDISERVTAEKELIAARDNALAGEKAKADLLAVMSHEMRTPINGIMGSLEVLGETALDAHQRRFFDAMQSSGQMLLRHINTVLDISKIDAGLSATTMREFDPVEVIANVVQSLAGQAAARDNRVHVTALTDDIGPCRGDAEAFEQIIANLLGNATKFTQDGDITIEAERWPESDTVEIRVIDTGIGIAAADQERIFSEFVTIDTSYARKVDGTGLGLAIARRLCRLMGGEIGVESAQGAGSAFWVRLPLPRRPARSESGAPDPPQQAVIGQQETGPLAVLLVEDNRINRLVAHEMLRSLGCTVTEAEDGDAAVQAAKTAGFDLILMDISMPNMNGVEATRQIRSLGRDKARIPTVAMTAHALPEDIAIFKQAGLSDVLVKPVGKAELRRIITRLGRGPAWQEDAQESGAETKTAVVQHELVETLGSAEAARITAQACVEIGQGVSRLRNPSDITTPADKLATLHQLAGLAAVVGLQDVRARLIAAQDALRADDAAALGAGLDAVDQALQDAPRNGMTAA